MTTLRPAALVLALAIAACSDSGGSPADGDILSDGALDTAIDAPAIDAGAAHPNEPAGMAPRWPMNPMATLPPTVSARDDFGFQVYAGQIGTAVIVDDPTAPGDDKKVMRIDFPTTHPGGGAPSRFSAGNNLQMSGTKTQLYMSSWLFISANWDNGGNAGTKYFFVRSSAGTQNHFVGLTHGFNAPYPPMVGLQVGGGFGNLIGTGSFPIGQWFHYELYFDMNTPGVADGIARVWVDGESRMNRTDVKWVATGEVADWEYVWIDPTYGGGANSPPVNMYFQIDDWYTSVGA